MVRFLDSEMIFDFLDKWVKKKENQSLLVNFLRSRKILKMMFAGMMMSFLDVKGFYSDLKNELNNAKKEVIICSPFAWTERLETTAQAGRCNRCDRNFVVERRYSRNGARILG